MKKGIRLLLCAVFSFVLMITVTNAQDLTGSITTNDMLGGIIDFSKAYDSTNDITNLKATITIQESLINNVLSQRPGNPSSSASLGTFYLGINPGLSSGTYVKENKYYTNGTNVAGVKSTLENTINGTALSEAKTDQWVWTFGVNVQYFDGNNWKDITDEGNGTKSIGANLAEKLGVSESALVYGENFRFFMWENYSWLFGWKNINTNDIEYISVSYVIKFPITAKMEDGTATYYPTLKGAIESGSKNIVINENLIVDEDVTIPADTEVTINSGVTVTLNNAQLVVKGELNNNGAIIKDRTNYYTITTEVTNGKVNLNKNLAANGEEIEMSLIANQNYKLKSIKVVDLSTGNEITVNDNKFNMPNSNVKVVAEYEFINPNTLDNVHLFVAFGLIALIGTVSCSYYLKRQTVKVK